MFLVAAAPLEPVVRGGRDQECRGRGGAEERHEVDVSLKLGYLAESLCERNRQEEREQDLDARQGDAQLVQELDQLTVFPFLLALSVRHVLMFPEIQHMSNERSTVRIESSVTAISWIPSEAVEGLPKIPFTMGVAHYDDPPPDVIEDLDAMREADAFREANELRAYIEVADDGSITDAGHLGTGHLGVTRIKVGPKELSVAAVALPTIQAEPQIGDGWVRFKQTAGGRTGAPAPRRVRGKPFMRISSAIAWTTLALTIKADGTSEHELAGESPFPRHWVYDKDGKLVQKSGTIDFEQWYRESHGENTPWGSEETEAFVTEAESALERELSRTIMRSGATSKPRQLELDETLTEQGETGDGIYLLLDGVLGVEVDGETVAQVGPGAVLGARALIEGGQRTATLRAVTPAKVVVASADDIEPSALEELAGAHRREEG
jgi:hypothetical protein